MCMAADIAPPAEIFVHGYLLMGGQKLGKTMIASGLAGSGDDAAPLKITDVSPLALAEDFGVDPLRYHLLRDVPLGSDGDFSYEGIVARYNADLANNLGNLVSRVTTVVHSKCGGIGPAPQRGERARASVAAAVLEAATERVGRAGPPTTRSRRRGGSSARPTPSSRRPSRGRWSRARRSRRSSATRSRCCGSWRSWWRPPCRPPRPRSGAASGWTGDPNAATAAQGRRLGRLRGRDGGGQGGAAVPPAQGLTWGAGSTRTAMCRRNTSRGDEEGGRARPARRRGGAGPGGGGGGRPADLHRDRAGDVGPGARGGPVHRAGRRRPRGRGPRSASIRTRRARASTRWPPCWRAVVRDGDGSLVAVGECGLDYHYEHSPREAQRAAFAAQIALAHEYGLALVIHARDAWDDLFDVLAAERVPERTVLHCFTGGPDEVDRCLRAGMYVSFSGIVTFKNAADVRAAAARCPLERLLVETDSPFLAPVPHRGRTNEPSYLPFVGEADRGGQGAAASTT